MATLTVRVQPRSSRVGMERRGEELVVRVGAPPEGGRATEECRRVIAEAVGVPRSAVTLRSGTRSRVKVFDVQGLSEAELDARMGGLPRA